MQGAKLIDAELQGADLRDARFHGANLGDANLEGANLSKADLHEAKNIMVDQLCKAATLYEANMYQAFEKQIKETCPHLLEEQK